MEHHIIQINEDQQIQDVPFENGQGYALLVFDQDGVVDCIIYTRGLKNVESYSISLLGDNGDSSGVIFGPKENVKIRVGSLEGETIFKPNTEGELFVSMRNPIRMIIGAKELIFKIESQDGKEIIKTTPFKVINKRN